MSLEVTYKKGSGNGHKYKYGGKFAADLKVINDSLASVKIILLFSR